MRRTYYHATVFSRTVYVFWTGLKHDRSFDERQDSMGVAWTLKDLKPLNVKKITVVAAKKILGKRSFNSIPKDGTAYQPRL
jgi:hypothetical protein